MGLGQPRLEVAAADEAKERVSLDVGAERSRLGDQGAVVVLPEPGGPVSRSTPSTMASMLSPLLDSRALSTLDREHRHARDDCL
jgi:hypothetical protein